MDSNCFQNCTINQWLFLLLHMTVMPLRAFEVNSIDYLLKPVEPDQLKRALKKTGDLRNTGGRRWKPSKQLRLVLQKLTDTITAPERESLDRISSRVGEKIQFIELSKITHFFAEDKLTYAATESSKHIVDQTIAELEKKLESKQFVRIHRSHDHKFWRWSMNYIVVWWSRAGKNEG